jgi:hypothetical protein
MVCRTTDLLPAVLVDELLRVARMEQGWVEYIPLEGSTYQARILPGIETWIREIMLTGADLFAMWGASHWLLDGPKMFRPSAEQCAALEQIEVRLELREYAQPYRAILVELPEGKYGTFAAVLCHRTEKLLTCVIMTKDHVGEITTTIAVDGRPMELSISRFDDDCSNQAAEACRALRVAINSCLALVNFGCMVEYLLPKEVERDQRTAKEQSERGGRARSRLKQSLKLVAFSSEVVLHKSAGPPSDGAGVAGGEKSPHWRRGHWAMQVCGKGRAERKRILRLPVMVRADLFVGKVEDTQTVYKS